MRREWMIDFRSKPEMHAWMARMARRVEVTSVQRRRRMTTMHGLLRPTVGYRIYYLMREQPAEPTAAGDHAADPGPLASTAAAQPNAAAGPAAANAAPPSPVPGTKVVRPNDPRLKTLHRVA